MGFAWSLAACQPKIGDDCQGPADCSQLGDRICDFTQPGGYCTQFNCEPGSCPEDAICVAYEFDLSPVPACLNEQAAPRTGRTFCVRRCSEPDQCRLAEGYECTPVSELEGPNPWGARILPGDNRQVLGVCQTPFNGTLPDENSQPGVCANAEPPDEDAGAP